LNPTDHMLKLLGEVTDRGDFVLGERGLSGVAEKLWTAADEADDGAGQLALALLARVANFWLRPADWTTPYGPGIALQGNRTDVPSDLSDVDLEILRTVVDHIPQPLLRGRVHDVLFIRSVPRERIAHAVAHIMAVLDCEISEDSWVSASAAWERAVIVARRLNKPTAALLESLDMQLRAVVRRRQTAFLGLNAAQLMRKQRLGRTHARGVAHRLTQIANVSSDSGSARAYREEAAVWHALSGDSASAEVQVALAVQSLCNEAEKMASSAGDGAAPRAAHLFEIALQQVRTLSNAARVRAGVADLPARIARRIRELGAAQMGSMRAFTSNPISLIDVARQAVDSVKDRDAPDALYQFAAMASWTDFQKEKTVAEARIETHPLSSLFGHVHYSYDGRVVHRSGGQGGEPIYGTDPATWRQMMQAFDLRIGLLVQGILWPAYIQLSNDHHVSTEDFELITRGSAIVPPDRIGQYAMALNHGYASNFSTAMQLLVPQIENLIRFHLGNAGISTTTIEKGIEHEIGLSRLMEKDGIQTILGDDLCFEIRALFCGPLGPNLRNNLAHGLLSDAEVSSATAIYTWWFALRLVYVPFWNTIHDTVARDARQPTERAPDEGRS
jgi:hypothetical protein